MLTNQGRICDKEIKDRPTGLWCACRRPAVAWMNSKVVPYMELDYCGKHIPKTVPIEVLTFSTGKVVNENGRLIFRPGRHS